MKFSEINLNENLQKAIEDLGFKEPTTVQKKVIPYLLENITDMVALAQTGTGKTAAFGLPIINNTNYNSKFSIEDGYILVLHHEHDGRDLEISYAEKVVKHITQLWGSEVKLITMVDDAPYEI